MLLCRTKKRTKTMAASYKTIDDVITVVKRHVSDETFFAIISDLKTVTGNTSFETTIQRLFHQAQSQKQKSGPKAKKAG
jgi:hypothetical protein